MSAARAYLHPALKRDNCHLLKKVHVTRILFRNKTAYGVEYQQHGKTITATSSREVIVSAGSINSPQLLQLSGIGPKTLLADLGIPITHALEGVGHNMQEHLCYTHYYRSKVPTLNDQLGPWWGKLLAGIQYLLTRRGVLSLSINQAGGFVKSLPHRSRPNLQFYFAPIAYTTASTHGLAARGPAAYSGFLNSIGQLRPKSRGYLQIDSDDPFKHPKIVPNYYSADADIREMLEGARLLRAIANTPALSAIIEQEVTPGLNVESDDELIEDIRAHSSTVFHPTSTCMMGPDKNTAVVDNHCRVYGVNNLRVVDASVFPTVTSGNTNAPTIMVAEKASDLILGK